MLYENEPRRREATDRNAVNANAAASLSLVMPARKTIGLIAHDNRKHDLVQWAQFNRDVLAHHDLCATGMTGIILHAALGLPVRRFRSGPLGGDQQVGAQIVEGAIDLLVFFWDPLEPHPHDVDVKALLRIAVVYNVPVACNRASADFLISSPLLGRPYTRLVPGNGGMHDDVALTQPAPPATRAFSGAR